MADDNELNPHDRAALRKAADDLLKADRAEARVRAREERAREDAEADFAAENMPMDDERDEWDELLERVGGAEAAEDTSDARVEAAEAEAAEAKERALRLAAEMENLRRRTQREIGDAKAFAISSFARDMLEVADNLQRALAAVPEGSEDAALKGLVEGVEMTGRSLDRTLEKHGVRKLEPEGEKFDPNFHQAMFKVPNPEVPNNSVVQVVQAGYAIGPRVLRPAMVGVAEGGPKFVEPEAPEDDQAA